MTEKHVAVCDSCGDEVSLEASYCAPSTLTVSGGGWSPPIQHHRYTIPETWRSDGDKTFCSKRCHGEWLLKESAE